MSSERPQAASLLPEAALLVDTRDAPGTLAQLARVISEHHANISYVDIMDRRRGKAQLYFELQQIDDTTALVRDLEALAIVDRVACPRPFSQLFGKRVIVIGGGAQVGLVAMGAISEADRHNIRGERISVDTIPLVGEHDLAEAVRGVARLPRARILVLAGALMGGEITEAVREIRESGILVVSLNMAGSVTDVADLVVTDPVQAGVMAVMAIASTAKFDINRQRGRRY
ncbi:MAG: DUF5612 domain-containing protein [Chloroflexi bacterium]|nr:DUF5612 domain-containing protein [Chloroflexota bacterium]